MSRRLKGLLCLALKSPSYVAETTSGATVRPVITADPDFWNPDKALKRVRDQPRIQIGGPLPPEYLDALKAASRQYPDKELHVYGNAFGGNLEVLAGFEHVHNLLIDVFEATAFDVLAGFGELRRLGIGATRSTKPSMAFLVNCPKIERVWLQGKNKGLDALGALQRLVELRLENLKAKSLSFLAGHPSLERLEILYASTTDLGPLGEMPRLRRLWVARIRGLTSDDLAPLSGSTLDMLALNDAPKIEDLAPLGRPNVRHLSLDNAPNLRTLAPLCGWPSLEVLGLRNAVPRDGSLVEVARMPTLRHLAIAAPVVANELRAIQAVFQGESIWYRGEYLWGSDRPMDIIAERDQL